MAEVDTKSTLVQNYESTNITSRDQPAVARGSVRRLVGTAAVAAADDDGSRFHMMAVKGGWAPVQILLFNDAVTGGTDYNIGLYTAAASPVAVDDNAFADALSMATARVAPLDVLHATLNITNAGLTFAEIANLAAGAGTYDENDWFYLTATGVTVGSAAGDIVMNLLYVGE